MLGRCSRGSGDFGDMIRNVITVGFVLAVAWFLVGCTHTEYVRVPIEVEIPVAVPCVDQVAEPRVYATEKLTSQSGDGEVIRAMAIEIEERGISERYLRAILAGCTG